MEQVYIKRGRCHIKLLLNICIWLISFRRRNQSGQLGSCLRSQNILRYLSNHLFWHEKAPMQMIKLKVRNVLAVCLASLALQPAWHEPFLCSSKRMHSCSGCSPNWPLMASCCLQLGRTSHTWASPLHHRNLIKLCKSSFKISCWIIEVITLQGSEWFAVLAGKRDTHYAHLTPMLQSMSHEFDAFLGLFATQSTS